MGYDRIAAVYDVCIVAALVEHTHVDAENVRHVDRAAGSALIRADDHQMLGISLNVRCGAVQPLDELVDRLDRLKAVERDRVLHPRVVRIKGDDIFHTHLHEFLQSERAVQRFAAGALVLTALIKERHDDVDPAGLTADCSDDTLQILKMVIR